MSWEHAERSSISQQQHQQRLSLFLSLVTRFVLFLASRSVADFALSSVSSAAMQGEGLQLSKRGTVRDVVLVATMFSAYPAKHRGDNNSEQG